VDIRQRIDAELSALVARAELRDLEGSRCLDFSSNDYLGLATDPRMRLAILEAVNSPSRIASTGSRLLSGHDEVWTTLENDFAQWVGGEAALFFTSGYAANMGVLGSILQPEDIVFSDSANHASLIDGIRLTKSRRVIFQHLDLNHLEVELRRNPGRSGARFIVVESIFSMSGDRAPLAELAALAKTYEAELIVDEAHATGVCGPTGSGCVAEAGLSGRVFATVHTCGKALAAAGAFVCGSKNLRRLLINRARTFIFSTALPPYFAAQVAAGMNLAGDMEQERAHLAAISGFLRNELRRNGFDTASSSSQIVPVILGSNDVAIRFAERLKQSGFGVRPIRPPTVPEGTARLRLSLTVKHSKEFLHNLVLEMVQIRREVLDAQPASVSR